MASGYWLSFLLDKAIIRKIVFLYLGLSSITFCNDSIPYLWSPLFIKLIPNMYSASIWSPPKLPLKYFLKNSQHLSKLFDL